MKYLFLTIFTISTIIHLFASLKHNKKMRAYSKIFIIPSLIGFYCFSVPNIMWSVIVALIFSWIGDLLLIKKGIKWFTYGGISFLISHMFFAFSYLQLTNLENVNIWLALMFALIFAILVIFIFNKLKPHLPHSIFYPMMLYLFINGTMNCFAIYRLLSLVNLASIITVIGACLFFISDATLFFVRFKKDCKIRTHFTIMLTYSLAELLIVLGFIL